MRPTALELYDDALRVGAPLRLHWGAVSLTALDVPRWCADADEADETLLARCAGPTLDVGCGPGRLAVALARRGVPVLGVDVAAGAVALARARGALVLRRSVFDPLPGEGRWRHLLLVDGNVGIGGDPRALLARVHSLLAPAGRLHVEVEPVDVDQVAVVEVEDDRGRVSAPFRWARLGAEALRRRGRAAGLYEVADWSAGSRRFLTLERCRRAPRRATSAAVPASTASSSPTRLVR